MSAKPRLSWGQSNPAEREAPDAPSAERCLTLLVEGAALTMPEIDAPSYKEFRTNVGKWALQIPDRLPDSEKLILIRSVLEEFEKYRKGAETELQGRRSGWRVLTAKLFREVLASLGIDPGSEEAAPLLREIAGLATAEQIQAFCGKVEEFLHPSGPSAVARKISPLKVTDHSTANDNAAGLRGGGVAVEHVKRIMDKGEGGFVVIFRLSCLEVVSQRFGLDTVQDCLMAVSAFLTHSLHADDAIYHWSDSSLLAVVQGRANEQILNAELQRIANGNRDISIQVGDRTVMLRIPLSFEITPIERLRSADDVYKLSRESLSKKKP